MAHDDDDLQEEIRAHLAMAAEDRIKDGADPKSARQASVKEFGNVTLIREAARRVWTPRWLDAVRDILSDIRYAVRSLARNPGFSLTVIAVLTLGIAVNATVFTMVKSIALTTCRRGELLRTPRDAWDDQRRARRRDLVSRLPVHSRPRRRLHRTVRAPVHHPHDGPRP